MTNQKIKPQTLLFTLWIFILLNMIFRDLHQLGKKSFMEEILTGVVNGVEITDQLMLIGGFMTEIPILMMLMSRILNDRINKWTNIIASLLTMFVLATGLRSADMDDIFFMFFEFAAFTAIIGIAWRLPSLNETQAKA